MKKIIILMLLVSYVFNSHSQQLVIELFYNVGGYSHSALCVFEESRIGKCNVLSPAGNCWFDAAFESEGEGFSITMSNPSADNWIPGIFHLNANNPYVVFRGYPYRLIFNVIHENYYNLKKAQYGFRGDGISFGADKPVTVKGAVCNHGGCHCPAYKGYRTPSGNYKGNCTNLDGWGHKCNHSPEKHGL